MLHPIASWFHAIDLADSVSVTRVAPDRSRLEVLWMPDAPRISAIDWRHDEARFLTSHYCVPTRPG